MPLIVVLSQFAGSAISGSVGMTLHPPVKQAGTDKATLHRIAFTA